MSEWIRYNFKSEKSNLFFFLSKKMKNKDLLKFTKCNPYYWLSLEI